MKDISGTGGRTVLFVSHNMESIQQLCTRCVVLENGSTAFEGDVEQSISYYLSVNTKESRISLPLDLKEVSILSYGILDYTQNVSRGLL